MDSFDSKMRRMVPTIRPAVFSECAGALRSRPIYSAALLVAAFLVSCALSYLSVALAISGILLLLVVSAILSREAPFLFVLLVVSIQYIFGLTPSNIIMIMAGVAVVFIARCGQDLYDEMKQVTPSLAVLVCFIGLIFAHVDSVVRSGIVFQSIGMAALIVATFLFSRRMGREGKFRGALSVMLISSVSICLISFAYLYLPAPSMFASHSPLYDLRLNDLRLSGALDNPNALAKLLVPCVVVAFIWLLRCDRCFIGVGVFITVIGVLLAATGSKSVIISSAVGVCMLIGTYARARRLLVGVVVIFIAGCAGVFFTGAALPQLKAHAARGWQSYSEPSLDVANYEQIAHLRFIDVIRLELRIGVSNASEIDAGLPNNLQNIRVPNATTRIIEGAERNGLLNTGQRYRTFAGGLQAVRGHPWWGIGYKQWPVFMVESVGFPFASPHNGILEVWGEYGVLGLFLYLSLIFAVGARFITIERSSCGEALAWLNRGLTIFLLIIIVHEIVEVETIFALTPYALWCWAAIGLQDGIALSCEGRCLVEAPALHRRG